MTALPAAVGMSSLQFVNMNKSRNLFVLGFSVFMGIVIPGTDLRTEIVAIRFDQFWPDGPVILDRLDIDSTWCN